MLIPETGECSKHGTCSHAHGKTHHEAHLDSVKAAGLRLSIRSYCHRHLERGQYFVLVCLSLFSNMQKMCVCIHKTCIYIYTGAGHIIRISSKSWFISLIPFKKWNLYNVYIHSTQTDIFQVFISFNFDDYNWQLMKTPNSVSQKIRILLKTNTKKGFFEILANWKVWTWKVWACTALNT